jgi:hypothetical protein
MWRSTVANREVGFGKSRMRFCELSGKPLARERPRNRLYAIPAQKLDRDVKAAAPSLARRLLSSTEV